MKTIWVTVTAASIFLLTSQCYASASPHAYFSPHQYGILDSTITFTAKVIDADRDKYTIYWSETRWTEKQPRTLTALLNKENDYQSDWNLQFPSEEFHAGNYSVSASIIYNWSPALPFPVEFATQQLRFTLTEGFTGTVVVNNATKHRKSKGPFLVSAKNETEIRIEVDSSGILQDAVNMTWSWYIDQNTSIANTSGAVLKHNFTEAKVYPISARLEVTFNSTSQPNTTIVKYGNFSVNVTAKVPIINVNVSGDTWYRNDGRLLRIKITCEGTGPYEYCIMIKEGAYNITGNETCSRGNTEVTNDCEIPFSWLFGEGIHTLLTIIENDLGRYLNQTAIHVYKVARVQPLSLILVPITCSLAALVLIIFGIGYFWENRKRYVVEVADFDFGQHDELPYMTFLERLKDAMSSSSIDRQRLIIPPPDEEPVLSSRRSSQFS